MTTSNAVLLEAIASLKQRVEELQAQNTAAMKENKNQETYMRKQMDTIPLTVKQILDAFIAQFKEALEQQKSDQMSEAIQALVEAMNKLSTKLEDTSMVQLQVKQEVMSAYTEIMDKKTQITHNGQTQLPM